MRSTDVAARLRVVRELDKDESRSNVSIAQAAGCGATLVRVVRKEWLADADALRRRLESEVEDPFAELNRFLDSLDDREIDPRLQEILDKRETASEF